MAVGEHGITVDDARRDYRRFVNLGRLIKFIALLLFCIFAVWTAWYMNMPLERLSGMFGRIGTMVFNRMMPPDLDYAMTGNVFYSILETIEMSFLGTVYGVLLAVPVAWFGAWNVTPSRTICYPLGRAALVLSRAIPPIIWAMILVVILGFGPMAGTITLVLLTLSFAGKLMSDRDHHLQLGFDLPRLNHSWLRRRGWPWPLSPQHHPVAGLRARYGYHPRGDRVGDRLRDPLAFCAPANSLRVPWRYRS